MRKEKVNSALSVSFKPTCNQMSASDVIGQVTITLFDEVGEIVQQMVGRNLITDVGLNWQVNRTLADASHIAIGSGTTPPAAGDTVMEAEIAREAITGTSFPNNNTVRYTTTFIAGVGGGAITEYGLFNAGVGGLLIARITQAVINKGPNMSLQIDWDITTNNAP